MCQQERAKAHQVRSRRSDEQSVLCVLIKSYLVIGHREELEMS